MGIPLTQVVLLYGFCSPLSLYVLVLVFIMACIGFPLVGSTWLLVFVGGLCIVGGICYGRGLWVVGELCGNSSWARAKASLINFGVALNFCLNSSRDSIWCVSGFWI